jgi:hypothetical protein
MLKDYKRGLCLYIHKQLRANCEFCGRKNALATLIYEKNKWFKMWTLPFELEYIVFG